MDIALYIAVVLLLCASVTLLVAWLKCRSSLSAMREKYAPMIDIAEETSRLKEERDELRNQVSSRRKKWEVEIENTLGEMESLTSQVDSLRDSAELQSFGLYEPHFDFDTSAKYKDAAKANRGRQKSITKNGGAAVCAKEWLVEGSKVKGRQMTKKQLKLMLRAFNGECDSAISKTRFNNVTRLEERIGRSLVAINKLGETNTCRITEAFRDLKVDELRLAHEYAQKKEDEREEQRRIRAEMREEERARKEIQKAQKEAEKEEIRYEKALVPKQALKGLPF